MIEASRSLPFILGSYAACVVVLTGVLLWLWLHGQQLQKTLARLQAEREAGRNASHDVGCDD